MRKFYYTLITLLMVAMISQARDRSVYEKNLTVHTHEFKYPAIGLPEETTYDFEIIMPYSVSGIPASSFLASEMQIEGWDRVYDNPAMLLSLYLDEPRMSPEELRSRYEVTEDSVTTKKGKRILRRDTTWFYQYRVTMEGRGKLEGTDEMGRVVHSTNTRNFCTERLSREFCSKREALRDMRMNADLFRRDMILEWYDAQVRQACRIAENSFAFYERRTNQSLKKIGNKKHKEYASFNQKVAEVANILSSYRPTVNRDVTMDRLERYAEYFDKVASKYTSDKRNARKMQYVALYNKYVIHSLVDNYTEAIAALNQMQNTQIKNYLTKKSVQMVFEEKQRRDLNRWGF